MDIPARWWKALPPEKSEAGGGAAPSLVACGLCPHACRLADGQSGYCGARRAVGGRLESPFLGLFSSSALDPIEKKPLYHWRPGSFIFSLGSVGCTMRCPFCQNYSIAQPGGRLPRLTPLPPQALAALTREKGWKAVAFTYNEPVLQAEYILKAAPLLKEAGVAVVLVTNGMIMDEPLEELLPHIAAANVDVKSFSPAAYRHMGGDLARVCRTVECLKQAGVHVEATTLAVPGISDDAEAFAALVDWLAGVDPGIPLHLSRYFPAHRFTAPQTDIGLMRRLQRIAEAKLRHVYLGNIR